MVHVKSALVAAVIVIIVMAIVFRVQAIRNVVVGS